MSNTLILQPEDNVAVALADIPTNAVAGVLDGTTNVQIGVVKALQDIPCAHKIAVRPISRGKPVIKYGVAIGFATTAIAVGEWIHTHNVQSYLAAILEAGNR